MAQFRGTVRLVASGGRFGIELDDDGRFLVADQIDGKPLALGHSVSGITDTPGICIARNETISAEVALHIDRRGVTPRGVEREIQRDVEREGGGASETLGGAGG